MTKTNVRRLRVAWLVTGYAWVALCVWQVTKEHWLTAVLAGLLWMLTSLIVGFLAAMEKDIR